MSDRPRSSTTTVGSNPASAGVRSFVGHRLFDEEGPDLPAHRQGGHDPRSSGQHRALTGAGVERAPKGNVPAWWRAPPAARSPPRWAVGAQAFAAVRVAHHPDPPMLLDDSFVSRPFLAADAVDFD